MSRNIHRETGYQEDGQRDAECRHRGIEHITDMGKEWRACNARSQNGGIREWRELVAKIGTRNDRASNPPIVKTMGLANTHQCQSDSSDSSPRGTYHQTDESTKDTTTDQKYFRADNLHAIINHRGYNTRHHPRTPNGTYQQQDDDSGRTTGYLVSNLLFKILPFQSFGEMAYQHADG